MEQRNVYLFREDDLEGNAPPESIPVHFRGNNCKTLEYGRFFCGTAGGIQKLPKISFDYAIMEHAQEVLVSDANFDWDDIGNWTAISNHYEHDDANNVIHANAELLDCHDCIVFSHDKEKLITGIDLHGLVVVQTPDATLVAPANSTAKIKELLKQLSTKRRSRNFCKEEVLRLTKGRHVRRSSPALPPRHLLHRTHR